MTPLRCANSPSAARSFLRLANRNLYSTVAAAQNSAVPLEFLVPRCALRGVSLSTPTSQPKPMSSALGRSGYAAPTTFIRTFTASAARQATVCVQHPIKDEDGNDMVLEITPRAAKRLSEIMAKDANPNLALRIRVESGGCHGFQYLMSLVTIPDKDSPNRAEVINDDDIIFQFAPDDADASSPPPQDAPRIILDEPSLELLKGSKVDFTMELIGSQFKITDNPFASSSCGCGTSFDIKM